MAMALAGLSVAVSFQQFKAGARTILTRLATWFYDITNLIMQYFVL